MVLEDFVALCSTVSSTYGTVLVLKEASVSIGFTLSMLVCGPVPNFKPRFELDTLTRATFPLSSSSVTAPGPRHFGHPGQGLRGVDLLLLCNR